MIQHRTPHLTIFESALYRTTSTVLQTEDIVLIVDPNWLPAEVSRIRQFAEEIRGNRPLYLLFTHSDYDHILGWQAFPQAKVIASKAFADNPDKEKSLEQIRQFDEEYYIRRHYPIAYPDVDIGIFEDGQLIELGQTRLRFYLAAGHTADGLFAIAERTGDWIAGDYLSNIEFPFVYDSIHAYEETMQKAQRIITGHEPTLLIPGHGDATYSRQEMLNRCTESLHYLQQLRQVAQSGKPFPEKYLWERYGNKRGLAGPHRENIELAIKETKAG
ncbi:MAG: MBL fold metallo-hydrolase [Phaeodactylibacter sp.]|nr:MBL fold metallo-hydrolase [Phaeodactylibacter sp.]